MTTAWQSNAFQNDAFQIDAIVAAVGVIPSGGIPATLRVRARTAEEISRARSRFGIPQPAAKIIGLVAARQVERLERDEQKRFEELARELQLRRIEWNARYLEALNAERERLITAEIAALLRKRATDEEDTIALLMMAAAVA